jgi:hypothetical protein
MDDDPRWREQRRQAARDQAAAIGRRKNEETSRARGLVADFVREATARGLRTTELRARGYDGRSSYRTGLVGWYLPRDRTIAAGTDGECYLLVVPDSLRARLVGVTLAPYDVPLQIGRGARDGESIDLPALLQLRLDAGDDWPA